MDLEFGQDSSIDPIIIPDNSLIMSEIEGNPNHDESRDSILSNPKIQVGQSQKIFTFQLMKYRIRELRL